jgi:hypothetical protein
MARKKGGSKLSEIARKRREQKKYRETGGGAPRSSVPPLLKRASSSPSVGPKLGPKLPPGYKKDRLKSGLKRVGKVVHKGVFDAGTTFVNPLSAITDPLVGKKSSINAKNLGGRVLNKFGLGALVPDAYKPPGKRPSKPPEKPPKSAPLKTWRDRMNARKNLN